MVMVCLVQARKCIMHYKLYLSGVFDSDKYCLVFDKDVTIPKRCSQQET